MNIMKAVWRLGLCAFFVMGLTYGMSAHATELEGAEIAMQETHETIEQGKDQKDETGAEVEGKRKRNRKPGGEEPNGEER